MKYLIVLICLITINLFSEVIFENPIVDETYQVQDENLVKISFKVQNYQVKTSQGSSFGTKLIAAFQTKNVEDLGEYSFVQFIKGCQFLTEKTSEGIINKYFNIVITSFEEDIPFKFKDWVIDSTDKDPVYWSNKESIIRNFNYLSNDLIGDFNEKTATLFGEGIIKNPFLFIIDRPGQALVEDNIAKNLSLEFKTCLYREKDIPKVLKREDVNFATPIHCVNWVSSFVYNFSTLEFDRPSNANTELFCK